VEIKKWRIKEIKYMITYFKMKKNEWKIKNTIYGMIASVIDNQKELVEFAQKLYDGLKDVSAEDMQKELIAKIAELVHDENNKSE